MRRCCLLLLGCLLQAACTAPRHPAADQRDLLARQWVGRVVELRQSAYFGPLYEDTDRWLLCPHPPQSTSHLVDLSGKALRPPKARGIVPAGSRWRIDALEFPTRWALLRRSLVSPRFHPWVVLAALPDPAAADPPPTDKPYIWVLPLDLTRRDDVAAALAAAFSPPEQTRQWLTTRRPTVAVAIAHKSLSVGMQADEMVAAMGPPQRQFAEAIGGQRAAVAWYSTCEAWLLDDRIVELRPPRSLAAEEGAALP